MFFADRLHAEPEDRNSILSDPIIYGLLTGSMRSLRIEITLTLSGRRVLETTGSMRSLRIEILVDEESCQAIMTGSMRSLRIEISLLGTKKAAGDDRLHAEPEDRNTHTNFLKKLAF